MESIPPSTQPIPTGVIHDEYSEAVWRSRDREVTPIERSGVSQLGRNDRHDRHTKHRRTPLKETDKHTTSTP